MVFGSIMGDDSKRYGLWVFYHFHGIFAQLQPVSTKKYFYDLQVLIKSNKVRSIVYQNLFLVAFDPIILRPMVTNSTRHQKFHTKMKIHILSRSLFGLYMISMTNYFLMLDFLQILTKNISMIYTFTKELVTKCIVCPFWHFHLILVGRHDLEEGPCWLLLWNIVHSYSSRYFQSMWMYT